MTEEGKYIYCIINESKEKRFNSIGINNREVTFLPWKDIGAVVSPTPVINFDRLDKKELTRHVATHQKVNEEVMQEYDVVPMAFGVIAPSADEVVSILERTYFQFKTALKKITGKAEFVVQIFGDKKKFLEELVNTNPQIKELKEKAKSPLKGYVAKLKLGKLIFETAENKRKEYLKDVENSLKECSLDSRPGKLLDETMIGNISFLIEKKAESEFDRNMQELGKKYEGKLRFKYIGPMPPYSFVNINLSLGNFELIDRARKTLGLREAASLEEIKKAYYSLSHKYHPDKFQGTENQMKKITQSYSILESYCRSCDELEGKVKDRRYSFKEEDVKNSLIIKYPSDSEG